MTQPTLFTTCGEPAIRYEVDLDEVPKQYVDHVLEMIEAMARSGRTVAPGQAIQLGWSLLRVERGEGGVLFLTEPDFKSFPMLFRSGITESIRHMLLQLWHADSFEIPRDALKIPSIQQSAITCTRYDDSPGLILSRGGPRDAHDSGWFFGCDADDHDHQTAQNLRRELLYRAFVVHPQIGPWVTFPGGSLVTLTPNDHPRLILGGVACPLKKDSFLDKALHPA